MSKPSTTGSGRDVVVNGDRPVAAERASLIHAEQVLLH